MLDREVVAVCSQICKKHVNTPCGQNVEVLNVKRGGYWAVKDKKSIVARELLMLGYCKTGGNCGLSYLLLMNLSLTCCVVRKVGRHIDVT